MRLSNVLEATQLWTGREGQVSVRLSAFRARPLALLSQALPCVHPRPGAPTARNTHSLLTSSATSPATSPRRAGLSAASFCIRRDGDSEAPGSSSCHVGRVRDGPQPRATPQPARPQRRWKPGGTLQVVCDRLPQSGRVGDWWEGAGGLLR